MNQLKSHHNKKELDEKWKDIKISDPGLIVGPDFVQHLIKDGKLEEIAEPEVGCVGVYFDDKNFPIHSVKIKEVEPTLVTECLCDNHQSYNKLIFYKETPLPIMEELFFEYVQYKKFMRQYGHLFSNSGEQQ